MPRYILIEHNSGYIWGDVEAENELDAGTVIDRENKEHGVYEWGSRDNATYHVYRPHSMFPRIVDGQSQAEIEAVEAQCHYLGPIRRKREEEPEE